MLKSKKLSYIILSVLVLFCAGIVLWSFMVLKGFSFEPEPFISKVQPWQSSDKEILKDKIEKGKEFLYRMEDPDYHGFHKYYYAQTDSLEERLHTVYSASIIYTFLYIYDYDKDEEILNHLDDWAGFLLSMQETDKNSPRYGAFSYSYFLDNEGKIRLPAGREKRYVVGTSALSIFTLLRLHEITEEQKYLEAAILAGDWIISMQRQDGVVKPYTRHNGENWVYGNKLSLLYNGQCLSALSKLYEATKDKEYYDSAKKIADLFASKYETAGRSYVVGEYRAKNPISNTWLVMSLMDFYKAAKIDYYKDIIFELSSQIISNQMEDGRIDGAYSSSGNGWISEVMTDTYAFCLEQGPLTGGSGQADCEKYKQGALEIMKWIIARTYTKENSSSLPNPQKAEGGVFWNISETYVRTDSVCHALNGYTRIMKYF